MSAFEILQKIRSRTGSPLTVGLDDPTLRTLIDSQADLRSAIVDADRIFADYEERFGELLTKNEAELIPEIQADFVNFYDADAVNPYISLAAAGPWVITLYGAVLHDSGGYGMLGMGHAPEAMIAAMGQKQVMANVMTANFSQLELAQKLKKEIGHRREAGCPFDKFLCLNSGSESVSVATRITDIHAKKMTAAGGKYEGYTVKFLSLQGSFHGRTDRPAQFSHSTLPKYEDHLASFSERDNLITVPINDCAALEKAFEQARKDKVFFEAMFVEPVMGEGNPGVGIQPDFYRLARRLTQEMDTFLMVDSIQAGIRAHGTLSVVDYPGFEKEQAPDIESYSKALNAGQYPLSVLALGKTVADVYVRGVYGNTMTTNPRALDVACAVLEGLTPELRQNIKVMGEMFLTKFATLIERFPGVVTGVQGTGLLFAVDIHPDKIPVVAADGLEIRLRKQGIGVIHGGKNALRFTPHFAITEKEVDLIVDQVAKGIETYL